MAMNSRKSAVFIELKMNIEEKWSSERKIKSNVIRWKTLRRMKIRRIQTEILFVDCMRIEMMWQELEKNSQKSIETNSFYLITRRRNHRTIHARYIDCCSLWSTVDVVVFLPSFYRDRRNFKIETKARASHKMIRLENESIRPTGSTVNNTNDGWQLKMSKRTKSLVVEFFWQRLIRENFNRMTNYYWWFRFSMTGLFAVRLFRWGQFETVFSSKGNFDAQIIRLRLIDRVAHSSSIHVFITWYCIPISLTLVRKRLDWISEILFMKKKKKHRKLHWQIYSYIF